jgi:hypothetical protein
MHQRRSVTRNPIFVVRWCGRDDRIEEWQFSEGLITCALRKSCELVEVVEEWVMNIDTYFN